MATPATTNALNLLPRASCVAISTANPNRDGSGTIGTVITGTGNGLRVEVIKIVAVGTVTAGVVRLYIHDGASAYLMAEIAVPATTASATDAGWGWNYIPEVLLIMTAGWSIRASTERAETFHVEAFGWSI